MQSFFVYGRLLTRVFVNGIHNYSVSDASTRRRPYNQLELVSASCGFPKNLSSSVFRRGQFGDDACFIANHRSADVLGVADGVGGWRTYGIDPSLFSTSLMSTCEHLVRTGQFNPTSPASIIAKSYYELLESKEEITGSSTACVVTLDKTDSKVHTANIGDSGFIVVRGGKVLHRSEEQTHYFNTPYQLAQPPPGQSGNVLSDSPESADTSTFNVQEGDLILLATDGLFDNIPDSAIVRELYKLGNKNHKLERIQETVNSLASQARSLAFDPSYLSPFSRRAREHGIDAIGGKPDDVTIVLASVGT